MEDGQKKTVAAHMCKHLAAQLKMVRKLWKVWQPDSHVTLNKGGDNKKLPAGQEEFNWLLQLSSCGTFRQTTPPPSEQIGLERNRAVYVPRVRSMQNASL